VTQTSAIAAEDEIFGKAYDGRLMARLLGYLRPYRRWVVVSVIVLVALSVASVAPAIFVKFVIDSAVTPAVTGQIGQDEALNRLVPLGAVYLAVVLGQALLRYLESVLVAYVGQSAMRDLRNSLFRHIEYLSLSFFDRNPVGRLMTRLTNDVDALTDMVTNGVVALLGDFLLLGGAVVVLFLLDARLAVLTLCALPIVILLATFFRRQMRQSFRAIRVRIARINAYLNEHLSGMSTTQLYTDEAISYRRFVELNEDHRRANRDQIRASATFPPLISLTRSGTLALLVAAGSYWIIGGEMTIGTLVAFWQLIDQFFTPIEDLSEKYSTLQAAMASSERIFGLLDTQPTVVDPVEPVDLPAVRGEVRFDHVSFAYNNGDWVLDGIDFTIRAGESVAIVGATGAGKTSIISLLNRFYDVQRGRICLDGIDIRDVTQQTLRSHIGVVLQEPFIFAGTIASNLRLRDPSISDDRIQSAARFVNADGFIRRLPHGYDTVVMERGSTLSVGQRQLLAFARAIAFNPEILLVLDEATSSVDTETEGLIQDALGRMMEGRTSIVIAHRLSTVQHVDRILVLHKGRLIEQGTHNELLARRGAYHRLYELQFEPAAVPTDVAQPPPAEGGR